MFVYCNCGLFTFCLYLYGYRGLKYSDTGLYVARETSIPVWVSWIEMVARFRLATDGGSIPVWVSWIEIASNNDFNALAKVDTCMGIVD